MQRIKIYFQLLFGKDGKSLLKNLTIGAAAVVDPSDAYYMKKCAIAGSDWENVFQYLRKGFASRLLAVHKQSPIPDLPDPAALHFYSQQIQDGGERIMKMVENQQQHRHMLERACLNQRVIGQSLHFILGITLLLCSTVMIINDKIAAGSILIGLLFILELVIVAMGKRFQRKIAGRRQRS